MKNQVVKIHFSNGCGNLLFFSVKSLYKMKWDSFEKVNGTVHLADSAVKFI